MAISAAEKQQVRTALPKEGAAPYADPVARAVAEIRRRLAERAVGDSVRLADVEAVLAEVTAATTTPRRSARKGAFRRLMVRPFEGLLNGQSAPFPRAFLAHYFRAVEATGGDWLPRSEAVCRAVLQSLLAEYGSGLEWDVFYTDTRVRHVLVYALRHLFETLDTPSGQWQWDQMMLRPDEDGKAPAKQQADLIYRSLRDAWRALELELQVPRSGY